MNLLKKKKSTSTEKEEYLREFKKEFIKRSLGVFILIMICSAFKSAYVITLIASVLIAGFLIIFDKIFDLVILGINILYIKYLKEWFDGILRAKQKIQE